MKPTLATRFANSTRVLRAETPLSEDQMRSCAPSIFAAGKHASRSERYTYIPTIDVLRGLQREGFEPFTVAQGRSRLEGRSDYTKHMIRLRHAGQVKARAEANEIILINSHDGASSYQMLAGLFRFVCCNGLVCGTVANDIRVPHKGNIQHEVIDGAFRVLEDFSLVDGSVDAMKGVLSMNVFIDRRYGESQKEKETGRQTALYAEQFFGVDVSRDLLRMVKRSFEGCNAMRECHGPAVSAAPGAGRPPAGGPARHGAWT